MNGQTDILREILGGGGAPRARTSFWASSLFIAPISSQSSLIFGALPRSSSVIR